MVAGEASASHFSHHNIAAENQNAHNRLLGDIAADSTTDMLGKCGDNLEQKGLQVQRENSEDRDTHRSSFVLFTRTVLQFL